jgi:hypothetical protein
VQNSKGPFQVFTRPAALSAANVVWSFELTAFSVFLKDTSLLRQPLLILSE